MSGSEIALDKTRDYSTVNGRHIQYDPARKEWHVFNGKGQRMFSFNDENGARQFARTAPDDPWWSRDAGRRDD